MARIDQALREQQLIAALANPRGVNVAEFARDYDYVERTVRRDLQTLETLHPIHQVSPGVYRLASKPRHPMVASLLPDELLAIDAARREAKKWRRTRLGQALERAWSKLAVAHSATPTEPNPAIEATLSFGEHLGVDYANCHRIIATLESAIANHVAVSCQYQRIKGGEISERIIEPGELHSEPALDSLYLVAWCRLRSDVRVFAVHRFKSATCIESPSIQRTDSRSRAAFKNAFHIWRDSNAADVHLRFTGDATAYITERTIHRSERKVHNPDGSVDLFFSVGGIQEVLRWLLAYGSAVRVIAPPALIAAHQHELHQGLAAYAQPLALDIPITSPALSTSPASAAPTNGHAMSETTVRSKQKSQKFKKSTLSAPPRTSAVQGED